MTLRLSVVIAAYDEVENVEELTRRLADTLASLEEVESELIYVVEGVDGTLGVLQELAPEIPNLRVFYQEEPSGIGEAFRRGFGALETDRDVVVTMDADLNHQPEEIPGLLGALSRTGADILVGSRFVHGGESYGIPLWKRTLSGMMNRMMHLVFGLKVHDKTSGFRVYRHEVLSQLPFRNRDFAFLPEILILAQQRGFSVAEHPINFIFRERGRSKMGILTTSASYLRLFAQRMLPVPRFQVNKEHSQRPD